MSDPLVSIWVLPMAFIAGLLYNNQRTLSFLFTKNNSVSNRNSINISNLHKLLICIKCNADKKCDSNNNKNNNEINSNDNKNISNDNNNSILNIPPITTGQRLYEAIKSNLETDPNWNKGKNSLCYPDRELKLIPMRCFNACDKSNCILLQNPKKYTYHFATMTTDAQDIEDILLFSKNWLKDHSDALYKKGDRPPRLVKTLLSRTPPFIEKEEELTISSSPSPSSSISLSSNFPFPFPSDSNSSFTNISADKSV